MMTERDRWARTDPPLPTSETSKTMNLQENQLLRDFLTRLTQAPLGARDPEAETMINAALARQPDATYLLVQRALLLERALQQANAQLASLQERSGSSFGGGDTWSQVAPSRGMGNAPVQAPAPQAPSAPPAAPTSGGWGGLLGNVATTAAGVAGGALLFQGVESLFGHHGGGSFLGGGAGVEPVENVTVNNYASDDDSRGSARAEDSGADLDNGDFDDDSSWT